MPEYTVVPGPGDRLRQPLTTKHPRREVQQGPRREIQRPGARLNPHPRFRRLQTAEKNPPTGGIRRRADTAYSTQRWLGDGPQVTVPATGTTVRRHSEQRDRGKRDSAHCPFGGSVNRPDVHGADQSHRFCLAMITLVHVFDRFSWQQGLSAY